MRCGAAIEHLQNQSQAEKAVSDKREVRIKVLGKRLGEVQQDLKTAKRQRGELMTKVAKLESERKKAQTEAGRLKRQRDEADDDVDRLRGERDHAECERDELRQELHRTRSEYGQVKSWLRYCRLSQKCSVQVVRICRPFRAEQWPLKLSQRCHARTFERVGTVGALFFEWVRKARSRYLDKGRATAGAN